MPLTAKDILQKTFKQSFKGYNQDEVDTFLDQIIEEFKVLQNENASLKEALEKKHRYEENGLFTEQQNED